MDPTAALPFVPYHELDARPHAVLDGSPTDGTTVCLTHWPGIPGPGDLRADLSAQMAFGALRDPGQFRGATAASNNHFDQDGLVSLFAASHPEAALAREGLLVDVARAGDFGCFADRRAARISMVIAAYADPDGGPLGKLPGDYAVATGVLYTELLGRLEELCDHPERYRRLWGDEDATLAESEAVLGGPDASVEELPELDLSVVSVPPAAPSGGGHRFAGEWRPGLHPMAVNNATRHFTTLVVRGRRYEVTQRYETWVQYRTRRPRPRVDLRPLAEELNAAEHHGACWVASPPSALTPILELAPGDESDLDPTGFLDLLTRHLRESPAAWDPYAVREAGSA